VSVVDWSDAHKIAALSRENETLKLRAAERERLISKQAHTIAALYVAMLALLNAAADVDLDGPDDQAHAAAVDRKCAAIAQAWSVLAHCNGSTPPQQQGGRT